MLCLIDVINSEENKTPFLKFPHSPLLKCLDLVVLGGSVTEPRSLSLTYAAQSLNDYLNTYNKVVVVLVLKFSALLLFEYSLFQ